MDSTLLRMIYLGVFEPPSLVETSPTLPQRDRPLSEKQPRSLNMRFVRRHVFIHGDPYEAGLAQTVYPEMMRCTRC